MSAHGSTPHSPPAHVLNETTFRSVLVRERKRADRSDRPVLLLLARAANGSCSPETWSSVIESLAAAGQQTDLLGWYQPDAAVGLIEPDVGGSVLSAARELRGHVERELAARLNGEGGHAIALEVHAYPGPPAPGPPGMEPLESLLERSRVVSPGERAQDATKRVLDVTGSTLLLLLLAPVFVAIGTLVKYGSPGPVFFRQIRIGEKGRPFTMLKFRTMHVDVDDAIHRKYVSWFITASGEGSRAAAEGGLFKLTNDPRITRIGAFLRRTSLDELPQLWNVLRGEMSLVGPRPPLPYEVSRYKPWHLRRVLEVRPGITGLWQVTGRSRTTFDEMVRLDLRYARSHSLLTDLRILLATPRAVISGKGAC